MYSYTPLVGLMLSVSLATASSFLSKRDSWGPAFSLGPAKQDIISTTTTIYPGKMPSDQKGYLFVWLGISNGTGDLVQSIIGSYPAGESECSGSDADSTWCISSEVYGLASNGLPNQWVGSLTTADVNYENGIKLNYTLIDKESYLWLQTMEDAVTGTLLSTFNKTSGPMLGWGTALECQNHGDHTCAGTTSEQYYVNSTIILESADDTFVETLGASTGVVYTDMVTADNGKTWTIAKITIPAMESDSTDATSSPSADVAVLSSTTAAIVVATSSATAPEVVTSSSPDAPDISTAPSTTDVFVPTTFSSVVTFSATTTPTRFSTNPAVSTSTGKPKHHGHQGKGKGSRNAINLGRVRRV